jgi:hypothetical protein
VIIALVLVGLLVASFFVRRYREEKRPVRSWTPTDELFNDPSSNRVRRVWLDQAGTRRYVPEDEKPST